MPSFRQIASLSPTLPAFPTLLIDAASSVVQVGLLRAEGAAAWETSADESGVGVFQSVEKLQVDVGKIAAFVFCDGPGSVLGIRTVAMALRTWCALAPRPVFAYSSLAVVAHALGRGDVSVIADARRDAWHCYDLAHGLRRMAASELSGELAMPENFRHWSPLPPNISRVPYSLAALLSRVWDADLLRETAAPDAFLHEKPSYVTWTPRIHQAAP